MVCREKVDGTALSGGTMLAYYVVEPLDTGLYQIWRVYLSKMIDGEEPDDDGVVVDANGDRYTWRWQRAGEPTKSRIDAKKEAYRLWYPAAGVSHT